MPAGTEIVLPAGTELTSWRNVQVVPVGGLAQPPVSAVEPTVNVAASACEAKAIVAASARTAIATARRDPITVRKPRRPRISATSFI